MNVDVEIQGLNALEQAFFMPLSRKIVADHAEYNRFVEVAPPGFVRFYWQFVKKVCRAHNALGLELRKVVQVAEVVQ